MPFFILLALIVHLHAPGKIFKLNYQWRTPMHVGNPCTEINNDYILR